MKNHFRKETRLYSDHVANIIGDRMALIIQVPIENTNSEP